MHTLNLFLFHSINNIAGRYHALDVCMVFITTYGPYIALVFAIVIFLYDALKHKTTWSKLFLIGKETEIVLSVFTAWFITKILKILTALPRPFSTLPSVHQLMAEGDYSFPSNHATVSFAIATVVFLYHKKSGLLLYVLAGIVAISRVYVGVHYPLDVIVGALLGCGTPYLFHWGFSQIGKYKVQ